MVDDLPDAGWTRTDRSPETAPASGHVNRQLADVSLTLALVGAAAVASLLVAAFLGLSLSGLSDTVESWAQWWAVLYAICILPGLASIVLGQVALERNPAWLLLPGVVALVILTMVGLAFWPSHDAPFYSLVLNMLVGITYGPLFAVTMVYAEAKRDYRLMRGIVRPKGQATAIAAIILGWLETGFVAWFLFVVGLGGGHPLRALELLGLLFLWNSTVLIRLWMRYELGKLIKAGIRRI